MLRVRNFLTVLVALALFAGCNNNFSDSDQISGEPPAPLGPQTGTFRLDFQAVPPPAGVDAVVLLFRDAQGQVVFGPLEAPFADPLDVPNVPVNAATVEVDYLQNGGLALFESGSPLNWFPVDVQPRTEFQSLVVDPQLLGAGPARSVWTSHTGPARFSVATQGGPGLDGPLSEAKPFVVKGVGYSPAPIGTSNKFGPALGDFFWDGFDVGNNMILLDWEKVWKRDIESIRTRFNSVRLYSMLAVQLGQNGELSDFNTAHEFTHKKFLDACWNNGVDPIYVLVGIPMSSNAYIQGGNAQERAWWEQQLARTVAQLKDHPAVMGFTIFNEIGGGNEWGGNMASSQFYWQRIQANAQTVKTTAPDKLVGFAYFDAPGDVTTANNAGLLTQFGAGLDFWGVNSFQGTTLNGTLAPYRNLGAATKPVLFTEFGVSATTHSVTEVCSGASPTQAGVNSITESAATRTATAESMKTMIPLALNDQVVAGLFYFEWSDEWWKQDPKQGCYNTTVTTWEGGQIADSTQFPNGFDDEEGFGLHSIALSGRAANQTFSAFDANAAAANTRPDALTPRTEILDAIATAFGALR